jgi:hypothetical protein
MLSFTVFDPHQVLLGCEIENMIVGHVARIGFGREDLRKETAWET